VGEWWAEKTDRDWHEMRRRATRILQEEAELQQLVQLVGPDALSDDQQWLLAGARLLREGFLQQNALNPTDAYAVPEKQLALIAAMLDIYQTGSRALEAGASLAAIRDAAQIGRLVRMKDEIGNDDTDAIDARRDDVVKKLGSLGKEES
jgi:V/A-type H+-transporting ATPase subunit A